MSAKRGETARSRQMNELIFRLKNCNMVTTEKHGEISAGTAFARSIHSSIKSWVTKETVWVPMPGSGVSPADRSGEKTVLFAEALAQRFGGVVHLGLIRKKAVKSSHGSAPDERTTVKEHFASMGMKGTLPEGASVLLVDDVLTRGTTAVGALLRLQASGYESSIKLVAGGYGRFPDQTDPEDVTFTVRWTDPNDYAQKYRLEELPAE